MPLFSTAGTCFQFLVRCFHDDQQGLFPFKSSFHVPGAPRNIIEENERWLAQITSAWIEYTIKIITVDPECDAQAIE